MNTGQDQAPLFEAGAVSKRGENRTSTVIMRRVGLRQDRLPGTPQRRLIMPPGEANQMWLDGRDKAA